MARRALAPLERAGDPAQGHRLPRRRSRRRRRAAASAISTSWCRAPRSTRSRRPCSTPAGSGSRRPTAMTIVYYRQLDARAAAADPPQPRPDDRRPPHHPAARPRARRPMPRRLIAASVALGERPAHPLARGHRSSMPPPISSPTATSPAGLRNLWDIDRLLREFAAGPDFWRELGRAGPAAPACRRRSRRALRLAARPLRHPGRPRSCAGRPRLGDRLFEARLLARNGWGQETRQGAPLRLLRPLALAAHAAADAGAASLDQVRRR